MAREYKEQKNAETTVKILELEAILPDFCHGYIVSISGYNKPLTQLAYLQRIHFFLQWLLEYNSFFCKHYTKINEFKVSDLELLKKADFEEFLAHISKFGAVSKEEIKSSIETGKYITESKPATRNNYLSALRSLFTYFLENDMIDTAPVLKIRQATVNKTIPISLNDNQIDRISDTIMNGSEFISAKQEESRLITSARDLAIYTLALHTGIRISELVSLDVKDINWNNRSFKVIRKRGNEDIVYFDNTTERVLLDCLFISTKGRNRGTRLSVRSVERMVKKYAEIAVPEVKGMHVHSLRSTCATNVYEKSHDLVYTKSLLGHSSVNTTMRYVKDDEQKKKDNRTLLDRKKDG